MRTDSSCLAFRACLERALEGRLEPSGLQELAWHEHLLGCGACRELLEREEALEALLATLPRPRLAPDLARRVIARLRRAGDGLDSLLELDEAAEAPRGLAARILAGTRSARTQDVEARLDALLELDATIDAPPLLARRVLAALAPSRADALDRLLALDREPVAPDGLATRVLDGLAFERRRRIRVVARRRLVLAAAAVAAFALVPLLFDAPDPARERGPVDRVARAVTAEGTGLPADAELHAFLAEGGLEILQEPLLWGSDDDIELALAASLDARYEVVLDYDEQDPAAPGGGR